MPEDDAMTPADLEALIRLHDLVPIPPELMPRVLQLVREHRAAMRLFEDSGIDVRDVLPAQIYRP